MSKVIGWIVVLGLIGGGVYWWYSKKETAAKLEFRTASITRGDVAQVVTANGSLNAVTNVSVGALVSAIVQKIYVDHNSKVTNGQLIAELDPATYMARLTQAKADVSSARAQLTLAKVNQRRAAELLKNNLVAQSDFDQTEAELQGRQAALEKALANEQSAQVDVDRTKIYSPIDGTVINRAVDVGQTVQSSFSAPTLFLIANDLSQMEISAAVSEADIGGVAEKQEVTFTVDAYPNRKFRGLVHQVRNQPTTNQNVVTYGTIVRVQNEDLKLKPGMTANVEITIARKNGVIKAPAAALRFTPPKDAIVKTNTIRLASATNNVMASAAGAGGDDGLPPGMPAEFRKRILERHDKNSDGKLDDTEKKAWEEERERRRAQGGGGGGGGFGGGGGGGGRGFGGGGEGGPGGGSQRPRELPPFRTAYLVSTNTAEGNRVELQPVQVHIGITDNKDYEILEGLKEGDVVAIGSSGGATPVAQAASNPFGGPFGGGRGPGGGGGGRR